MVWWWQRKIDGPTPAWSPGPSILEALRAWDGRGQFQSPDRTPQAGKISFASGAWDGILSHHVGGEGEDGLSERVVASLHALVRKDDDTSRRALYEPLVSGSILSYADEIRERAASARGLTPERLRPHARWLVRSAAHREPLKLGIILLNICGTAEDVADLETLAREDEYTLFAAVAATRLVDDPAGLLWKMARRVHGWGKIHLVERLAGAVAESPEIRAWLLREGCDNSVMREYLAYSCATSGGLAEALRAERADDALIDGACKIMGALLCCGGPAADITSYPDGAACARDLVRHIASRGDDLARLEFVQDLRRWLGQPDSSHEAAGFTPAARDALARECDRILGRPTLPGLVRAAFAGEDPRARDLAWALAPAAGVDLWEEEFARLGGEPDQFLYYRLLRTDDRGRRERVVAFAEAHLPLAAIACGPADDLGLGPGYAAHGALDMILQEMPAGDLFSPALVAAALRSPVVRNRNLAVGVLERGPAERWDESIRDALRRLHSDEPDAEIRAKVEVLLGKIGGA